MTTTTTPALLSVKQLCRDLQKSKSSVTKAMHHLAKKEGVQIHRIGHTYLLSENDLPLLRASMRAVPTEAPPNSRKLVDLATAWNVPASSVHTYVTTKKIIPHKRFKHAVYIHDDHVPALYDLVQRRGPPPYMRDAQAEFALTSTPAVEAPPAQTLGKLETPPATLRPTQTLGKLEEMLARIGALEERTEVNDYNKQLAGMQIQVDELTISVQRLVTALGG